MPDRPNILLITSDQHHTSALGAVNPKIHTPALDRLCREGTRFDRAYCPNPTCTPTRASMITGLYPSHHGAWTLGTKLPEDVPTVGQYLREGGYTSALIGKAHFQPLASTRESTSIEAYPTLHDLDFWRGFRGPWYGFDHVETARMHADEAHAGQHYGIWMEDNGLAEWRDYFQAWPPELNRDRPKRRHKWDLPERYHYSVWTAERTIAALEAQVAAGQPFFTWSSFHDPHPPYLVPEPWDTMYDPADMEPGSMMPGEHDSNPRVLQLTQHERPDFSPWREEYGSHGLHSHLHADDSLRKDMAVYYGMASLMDREIGRILDAVDRLGLADNTVVVFSTDHGHYLGQHGLVAKGPFHYEDGIRIPFIVRWPGRVPAGAVNTTLQSLLDLPTTFLSLAGQDIPGAMQGLDQTPAWTDAQPVRREVICEFRHQPTVLHLRTYIDDRYKLTVWRNHDWGELYDLQDDPREVRNLWDVPEAAGLKSRLLLRFMQAYMEAEPTPTPRIWGA